MPEWFDEWVDRAMEEQPSATAAVHHCKVLPDGGELVYPHGQLEPVGDRFVPSWVMYRRGADGDQPDVKVLIRVHNGVPMVTAVQAVADLQHGVPMPREVRIGKLEPQRQLPYWVAEVSHRESPSPFPDGRRPLYRQSPVPPEERRAAIRNVERARSQLRRKVTDEFLARVAATYKAADPRSSSASKVPIARHKAVANAFGVSERTAQWYITRAKQAGLLDG